MKTNPFFTVATGLAALLLSISSAHAITLTERPSVLDAYRMDTPPNSAYLGKMKSKWAGYVKQRNESLMEEGKPAVVISAKKAPAKTSSTKNATPKQAVVVAKKAQPAKTTSAKSVTEGKAAIILTPKKTQTAKKVEVAGKPAIILTAKKPTKAASTKATQTTVKVAKAAPAATAKAVTPSNKVTVSAALPFWSDLPAKN